MGNEALCCLCDQELFEDDITYCEDCRELGDLEDLLDICFEPESRRL